VSAPDRPARTTGAEAALAAAAPAQAQAPIQAPNQAPNQAPGRPAGGPGSPYQAPPTGDRHPARPGSPLATLAPGVATPARFPDLVGRVAVVTGGSRGIGAATASLLAANGMRVALIGRDGGALDQVREHIWDTGGRAIAVVADCTDPVALAEAAAIVADEIGPIALLAAFAGGGGRPVPSLDMPLQEWRAVLDGDVTSTFATIQAFAPAMVAAGRGSIVTMSSAAGRTPSQANIAYAVAKAGVVMLTRHLAAELAPHRVRVNCVAPAAVHNEKMDRYMTPEQFTALGTSFPLGRVGEPIDVAAATAYLGSDASGWITGQTLDIAGGKGL
jgi:3-oxoacyl-[acyl-carrier protein] reductase